MSTGRSDHLRSVPNLRTLGLDHLMVSDGVRLFEGSPGAESG